MQIPARVCECMQVNFCFQKQTSKPICRLYTAVSTTTGVVQVTERSFGDPLFFSWLGCVSVLKFCWVSVAAFWLYSVQHQPTTGLMRSRFESLLGLEWDTDTLLAPKGCNHTTQPSRCFVHSCNARVNVQTVVCFPTWKCFSLVSVRLCMITLSRIHSHMSYLTKRK